MRNTPSVKAIPTIYRGIQMRSRLEATWAAFFDQIGIRWEYEPAIFDTPGWSPDFYLPHPHVLCEVKPVLDPKEWEVHDCVGYALDRLNPDPSPEPMLCLLGARPLSEPSLPFPVIGYTVCQLAEPILSPMVLRIIDGDPEPDFAILAGGLEITRKERSDDDAVTFLEMYAGIAVCNDAWAKAKNTSQWRPPK